MKIAIDARMYQESGIGRYIRNLLNQLEIIDKKNEYLILLSKDIYHKKVFKKSFKKVLANFRWYGVSEQIKMPRILNDLKPDLVHFPHFNVPILFDGEFVVTIHDLIHQHFQMKRATTLNPLLYKIKQYGYQKIFKSAVSKSKKILVPSNYVKDSLVKKWQVEKDKIVVTYEAVDDKMLKVINKMNKKNSAEVLRKFHIDRPFIFYLGNAHPHKNVEGLIKAFLKLRKNYQYLKLVLSGSDHYFWQRIRKEFQHKDIIYTGFVSEEELVALYKNAQAFVLPSFEEGFGIPLLEAMVCECPIVTSNGGSLPEVGGEAAIYFNPHNEEDIIEKIDTVLKVEKIRKDLISKGIERAKGFSWDSLAKKTLEVYSRCGLH